SDGVERIFNVGHRFRTGPVGDLLRVVVEPVATDKDAHLSVAVVPKGSAPMNQYTWPVGHKTSEYLDEFAHQLGLWEEYFDPDMVDHPNGQKNSAGVPGSLKDILGKRAPKSLVQGGLQDKHLDLIGGWIGEDMSPGSPVPLLAAWGYTLPGTTLAALNKFADNPQNFFNA